MEKYRFDDAYEQVYEYDAVARAYLYIGSYYAFELTTSMSDKKKERIVIKGSVN